MKHILPECRRHYAEVILIVTKIFGQPKDIVLRVLDRMSLHEDAVQELTLCNIPFYTAEEILHRLKHTDETRRKVYEKYLLVCKSPEWLEAVEAMDQELSNTYGETEMPFPLMMEQYGIVVGVIDYAGAGEKWPNGVPVRGKTPDPVRTVNLLRALADKIEEHAIPKETE